MRYMLLIHSPESCSTSEDRSHCKEVSESIGRELAAEGKLICSSPLHPPATAGTVRVRQGERLITTGPFAETTEHLGGFFLLDVANPEDAIAVAERLPPAQNGTIEVRPVREVPDLPPERIKCADVAAPIRVTPDLSPAQRQAAAFDLRQYMILCYHDEAFWKNAGEAAYCAALGEAIGLCRRLDGAGRYLSASPLQPSTTAKHVRVRDERAVVTDGPFAETREVLGGYYLILAEDQAEALSIGAQTPGARDGSVEVRQVMDVGAAG